MHLVVTANRFIYIYIYMFSHCFLYLFFLAPISSIYLYFDVFFLTPFITSQCLCWLLRWIYPLAQHFL